MAGSLILIGFMGSGKTAVGQELASRSGMGFRDADQAIEEKAGMTVAEIFDSQGEAGFRRLEEETVTDLLDAGAGKVEGLVISLGGGAVTSERLRSRLAAEPLVVLLDTDVELAFHRSQDGSRPLARDQRRFRELYRERQPLYESVAKFRIDTRGKSIRQVTAEILGATGKGPAEF